MNRLEIAYDELETFTAYFAQKLKPNTTILLNGEIGTGKTTFTKHLFKALGYAGVVTSPTFTLIKQYEGTQYHLIHVDAYRNEQGGYIELNEYIEDPYILCVEWAKYIESEIPSEYLQIDIEIESETARNYTIQVKDGRYAEETFIW